MRPCASVGGLAEQVEVQLVQLAADGVAEAREVRRRADDVGERHQQRALEATPQLVLQLVLQTDDLGHAERAEGAEIDHAAGRRGTHAAGIWKPGVERDSASSSFISVATPSNSGVDR